MTTPERAVKKGDEVHLVAAREVRVGGKVVIAKGATARASVAWAKVESRFERLAERFSMSALPSGATPFRLQLEWSASVNGVPIPLAPVPGKVLLHHPGATICHLRR